MRFNIKIKNLKDLKVKELRFSSKEFILFLIFLLIALIFKQSPTPLAELEITYKREAESSAKTLSDFLENKTANETINEVSNQTIEKSSYVFIERRNLFTPEGSYSETTIPENPYTLVAIKLGEPKQAILKLFTGDFIMVKEKDTLIDGAKVIKITEKSVIIERLGKKRELFIFKAEVEKWKPKSW